MPDKGYHYEIESNTIPERSLLLQAGMEAMITRVVQYNSNEGQNFMRANAPWTDRTGNARQGLFAKPYKTGKYSHVIVLYHSVPYGIWLELANDRKYKIIEPAWRRTGQRTMEDLQRIMAAL